MQFNYALREEASFGIFMLGEKDAVVDLRGAISDLQRLISLNLIRASFSESSIVSYCCSKRIVCRAIRTRRHDVLVRQLGRQDAHCD
jgi:hypothetical protein